MAEWPECEKARARQVMHWWTFSPPRPGNPCLGNWPREQVILIHCHKLCLRNGQGTLAQTTHIWPPLAVFPGRHAPRRRRARPHGQTASARYMGRRRLPRQRERERDQAASSSPLLLYQLFRIYCTAALQESSKERKRPTWFDCKRPRGALFRASCRLDLCPNRFDRARFSRLKLSIAAGEAYLEHRESVSL